MTGEPEVYFHVGLGKVASTYLQKRVFPKLEGIRYIPTVRYKKSKQIIAKGHHKKYLVSREFDRQFEREVRWFTETYPQARIIVIFRRHDSWVASQYRRYVKNGWSDDFRQFFDLEKDQGFWKQTDLYFYPKLKIIEECSQQKPLILFHDELKGNAWSFFDKISLFTGTTYSPRKVSLTRVHTSYSEKQLKLVRAFCQRYKPEMPKSYHNKFKYWLLYRPWWTLFHLIMYAAPLVPDRWVDDQPLIDHDDLQKIRAAYEEDWKRVEEYAQEHNPD
ncbi:MAG: hypothetical protein KI790_16440 [Cyclobacteriaceae bacterium]|nr:hypothetical protein [Cyclobacteriaceae bacterium HetDA_MAG_MS6]